MMRLGWTSSAWPFVAAFGLALSAAIGGVLAATPQTQSPTFRGTVDVIALDVQVVDRDGQPVRGLTAGQFEVSLGGKKRRVVSAQLVDVVEKSVSVAGGPPIGRGDSVPAPPQSPPSGPGRVFILAIDSLSFSPDVSHGVVVAARGFIEKLAPTDEVGLFAYPMGPKVDPTTDHAKVIRELVHVSGQRGDRSTGEFHLRPSEVIDLALWVHNNPMDDGIQKIIDSRCGVDDDQCRGRLAAEAAGAAMYAEGQGSSSLGMLRSLIHALGKVPIRKTLVLVSAGVLASDRPAGRPDLSEEKQQIGVEAAQAKVTVYTLFIDSGFLERYSAETRRAVVLADNLERDSGVLAGFLDQLSGRSGGTLTKVLIGSGDLAYERILKETSAYYLLGVQPLDSDADGKVRELTVKVTKRGATVRGRSFAVVTRSNPADVIAAGTAAVDLAAAANAPPPPPVVVAPPPPPAVKRPPSAALAALFDAFARDDAAALEAGLGRSKDLASLLREFREAANPWAAAPRRQSVFVLSAATAGLFSQNGDDRLEASKLLIDHGATVAKSSSADNFACRWFWAELALLEGTMRPGLAEAFVQQAVDRCPGEGRLMLARAVIADQRWPQSVTGAREGAAVAPPAPEHVSTVIARYQAAIKFRESESEARVRLAWFFYRLGRFDEALPLVTGLPVVREDPETMYLGHLVRGQILRGLGQLDAAAAEFRTAIASWPGAQSARTALMTLVAVRGEPQEAARLADAIETAPSNATDPWWWYWQGDFRFRNAIMTTLRGVMR